ncbi:putative LPS assembly protein LptD [Blattabacterium cuenoti]|uniref:putative LPS assembly protein LptD n=1 Tax=Blattabacterium cuenoti TaxID=1653831 RepID=UPI001EEBC762|nr:putative LPS assembly protein LptD [Blattabacterium cuenoti]
MPRTIIFLFVLFPIFSYAKEENKNYISFSDSESKIEKSDKDKYLNIVKYNSDIQEHNIEKGKSYLNGNALIEYLDTKIEADRIEFNWKKGYIYAIGKKNHPIYLQKGDRKYSVYKLFHLDLGEKKWNAKEIYIQEKDHVIIANSIKEENNYSLMEKVIYTADPLFIEKKDINPDFYLKTNYLKYFHKKKSILTGPVFFYLYQVPIPIVFPFLYIPDGISSYGIPFPRFGIKNKKIYIENIGIFFPISNYFNCRINGSMYGIDKWKLKTEVEYKLKYGDNGSIFFDYQSVSKKDFDYQLKWKHDQDIKYNSEIKFNADINYHNKFTTKTNSFINNEVNISNISVRRKFQESFLSMEAYMIQNIHKGEMHLKVPKINLSIRKRPFIINKNPFLRQFVMDYQVFAYNSIYPNKIEKKIDFQTEINNTINLSTYYLLPVHYYPYLKISPKIHYKGSYTWYFFSCKSLFQTIDLSMDILFPSMERILIMKKKYFLLRYKMEPMLSFNFGSNFPIFIHHENKNSIKKRIHLTIDNNLELKIKNNREYEKIKILESFQMRSSYIFEEELLKWENLYFTGYTDFTKYLGIKYEGRIDFYEKENCKSIFLDKKKFKFDFSLRYHLIKNQMKLLDEKKGINLYECFFFDKDHYAKYSIPLDLRIDFNSNYENNNNKPYSLNNTFLSINGSIGLTKYWDIEIHADYDLFKKRITFANIIFYRDLRSFKMNFNWYPIGKTTFWSFFIGIKDSNLSHIIQYKETN